jgi:glycosyltransferase involved in cell wall biosynthesis
MIPERLGFDLTEPMWRQKHDAISYASGFVAVSQNTLTDLRHYFPETDRVPAIVASPGVGAEFYPSNPEERRVFDVKFVVPHLDGRPYFLFVSQLSSDYKNVELLLRALGGAPPSLLSTIAVLFTYKDEIVESFRALAGLKVHATRLNEVGLRAAYSSALALIYPSRYEGFGLPLLEAMACGCPVICANTSAIPEAVGDAALLLQPDDDEKMKAYLLQVQDGAVREQLSLKGIARAKLFSWDVMAAKLADFLTVGYSVPS